MATQRLVKRSRNALLAAALVFAGVQSKLPGVESTNSSARFLFLVETSRAMQRRPAAMVQSIQTILSSRCGGQLREGDQIGVWSYSEGISKALPFERWSAARQADYLARVNGFVNAQKFENHSQLETVWPVVQRLVREGAPLSIILICSGEDQLAGTPFDRVVTETWANWQADAAKARMPILTLLRTANGNYTTWAATTAPWPLEFPTNTVLTLVSQPEPIPESKRNAAPLAKPALSKTKSTAAKFSPLPEIASPSNVVAFQLRSNTPPQANASKPLPPPVKPANELAVAAAPTPTNQSVRPEPGVSAKLPANQLAPIRVDEPPQVANQTPPRPVGTLATTSATPGEEPASTRQDEVPAERPPTAVTQQPAKEESPKEVAVLPNASPVSTPALVPAVLTEPPGSSTLIVFARTNPNPADELAAPMESNTPAAGSEPTAIKRDSNSAQAGALKSGEAENVGATRESFWQQNLLWLALLAVTGSASGICFLMYFRSRARVRLPGPLLPPELKMPPEQRQRPAPFTGRSAELPKEEQRDAPPTSTSPPSSSSTPPDSPPQPQPEG